jgi:hypothetical protein
MAEIQAKSPSLLVRRLNALYGVQLRASTQYSLLEFQKE